MNRPGVEDRYAKLGSLRFHYRDWGNEGAAPLLLLHGLSGHGRFWDSFAAAMADHFHVIAPDARGHGESDWAADYATPTMAADVTALVGVLGLSDLSVVGLSMGGLTSYYFAAARPAALRRLVIVDIGPEVAELGGRRIRDSMTEVQSFATLDALIEHGFAVNPNADRNEVAHRFRNNAMVTEGGRWRFRHDVAGLAARLPRDPAAIWALLPQIAVPTLLVRGGTSDVLDRSVAERVAREIPDCRLAEVAGAGHSVPMEDPAGFLAAVRPFLIGRSG